MPCLETKMAEKSDWHCPLCDEICEWEAAGFHAYTHGVKDFGVYYEGCSDCQEKTPGPVEFSQHVAKVHDHEWLASRLVLKKMGSI